MPKADPNKVRARYQELTDEEVARLHALGERGYPPEVWPILDEEFNRRGRPRGPLLWERASRNLSSSDLPFVVVVAILGLIVWLRIGSASAHREPWDDETFFTIGLPLMLLISVVAGFLRPGKPWLWGIATVILQPFALVSKGVGSMIGAGLFVFAIMAALCAGTAYVGQAIRAAVFKAGKG